MLRMKWQSYDDYPDTGEELHILVHKEDKYIPAWSLTVTFSHHFAYQVLYGTTGRFMLLFVTYLPRFFGSTISY